ncbi:MAG: hypothetical protein M1830_007028, partial [Pleopsidium flavum]
MTCLCRLEGNGKIQGNLDNGTRVPNQLVLDRPSVYLLAYLNNVLSGHITDHDRKHTRHVVPVHAVLKNLSMTRMLRTFVFELLDKKCLIQSATSVRSQGRKVSA